MTAARPKRAMILAAGLGKRMRPITVTTPKPLVEVAGRALIDHGLDRLERAGVAEVVVNVHYLPDLVETHVARRRRADAGPRQSHAERPRANVHRLCSHAVAPGVRHRHVRRGHGGGQHRLP